MFPGSLAYALPGVASSTSSPSFPDIEFVSALRVTAATMTLPEHAEGDLIVMVAVNIDGNGAPNTPTAPSGEGWTVKTAASRTGFGAKVYRTYSKIAASASEETGTWTGGVDSLQCHVYRNAGGLGAGAIAADGTTNPDIPFLSLNVTDGSSWVMSWVSSVGPDGNVPSALTERTSRTWDTDGAVASFPGYLNVGDDNVDESNWASLAVEILKKTS